MGYPDRNSITGITMGCPASVGPEIILRFFSENSAYLKNSIVIGDCNVLKKCARALEIELTPEPWNPGEILPGGKVVSVYTPELYDINQHHWGIPDNNSARAMAGYITAAVTLAKDNIIDAITTCPISKESLQNAGVDFPGHTEMLARLTSTENYGMMLAGPNLRVVPATIHCALSEVPGRLSISLIEDLLLLINKTLVCDFGIKAPKIGVAGLNPHAGENGLFGNEERDIILPAIIHCRKINPDITGPCPGDTVFFKAYQGEFDAVLCMYHDQGLGPFKLVHFADGVNVTMGLPLVRTSVDHGTAYDIAGKGIANPASLKSAVELAFLITENRKKKQE